MVLHELLTKLKVEEVALPMPDSASNDGQGFLPHPVALFSFFAFRTLAVIAYLMFYFVSGSFVLVRPLSSSLPRKL